MNIHDGTRIESSPVEALYFSVLNPTVLEELSESVGADYVPILLHAFRDDLKRLQQKAKSAVEDGDRASFNAAIHSLRGVSTYFGADYLAGLAADGGFASPQSGQGLTSVWIVLEPALDASMNAVSTYLEGLT